MFRTLRADTRASISVIAAVVFTALIGMSALAIEYGNGLLTQSRNQRLADVAAYSGALVYSGPAGTAAAASAAVTRLMALNGISAGATASLINSPTGDGNQALKVRLSTNAPLRLAKVLHTGSNLPVTANSFAEVAFNQPACIVALASGGTGITLTGGTSITASSCTVASNNSISVHCGDTITTQFVDYGGAPPTDACNGIQPPAGGTLREQHTTVTDPFANDPNVATARQRVTTVTNLTPPGSPTVPAGQTVFFDFNGRRSTTISSLAAAGCTGSFNGSSTWTVTCSGNGPFNFGTVSMQGGLTVNFNVNGATTAVYNFNGMIDFRSGTAFNFGPGTFNVVNGIVTGGGSTMSFGAGTFNLGKLAGGICTVNGESICHNGTTLTFGGPSAFTLNGGVYVPGGFKLTMGAGNGNSFNFGTDANGDSLNGGGGSNITFADATGTGNRFQMAGNFNDNNGGGSCVSVGAATNHDINGYLKTAGGVTLGAGIYTVSKYVGIGVSNGGDVTCNGVTVGINAVGVTFVIGGTATETCTDGSNQIFCIGAGYADVTITAPTSGNMQGFAVIGPSTGTAGVDLSNGATHTIVSGAFYVPNGTITMSGAATLGDTNANHCLDLIGSQINVTAGSALGSSCTTAAGTGGNGGGTGAKISLVR